MGGRKESRSGNEGPGTTAREEQVLLFFRLLSTHQQRELIIELQALSDANRIARSQMKGKPLRAASNEAVRAAFKDTPPPPVTTKKKRPAAGRNPDDMMGDYPEG